MRRHFLILLGLTLLVVASVFLFKPTLRFVLERQIKERLSAQKAKIGEFNFKSWNTVLMSGVEIEKKKVFKINIRDIEFSFDQALVTQASLESQKLRVDNINFAAHRVGNEWTVPEITGDLFGGTMKGEGMVRFSSGLEYRFKLRFFDMSIVQMITDFKVGKKVEMTGLIDGEIQVAGRGEQLSMLGGGFRTDDPGGKLIIKDRKMLENVVDPLYLDTVVETLQDYDYNAGGLAVNLKDNDLIADIQLEGPKGKRNFTVVYHR